MMKNILIISLGLILLSGACATQDYKVEDYLTDDQQRKLISEIVRYTAKLPPGANHGNKWSNEFNSYYDAIATEYDIRAYAIKDSVHFVLITRQARSITPMREAIGIKIKYASNTMSEYEEVFRTWKMRNEILNERFPILFDKMIKGENLEAYYTKNAGDQYIEFPDDRFYFDKQKRKWNDRLFDSLNVQLN